MKRLACGVLILAPWVACMWAQQATGPRPPKPDIPYLLHASQLIEPEIGQAKEFEERNMHVAVVAGGASPVKTPVPEPIFLFESKEIQPSQLQMFPMQVRKNERRLELPTGSKRSKNAPRPVILMVNKLGSNLYRIEVNQPIEVGEYCISPSGRSDVFCFSVF